MWQGAAGAGPDAVRGVFERNESIPLEALRATQGGRAVRALRQAAPGGWPDGVRAVRRGCEIEKKKALRATQGGRAVRALRQAAAGAGLGEVRVVRAMAIAMVLGEQFKTCSNDEDP